jgi:hypothetical protein
VTLEAREDLPFELPHTHHPLVNRRLIPLIIRKTRGQPPCVRLNRMEPPTAPPEAFGSVFVIDSGGADRNKVPLSCASGVTATHMTHTITPRVSVVRETKLQGRTIGSTHLVALRHRNKRTDPLRLPLARVSEVDDGTLIPIRKRTCGRRAVDRSRFNIDDKYNRQLLGLHPIR